MTSKKYHIAHFLILLLIFVSAENIKAQYRIQLFPDRNFCVSGDTLWFRTIIFPDHASTGSNVVHVQLDNTGNRHITKVSVLCEDNQGQGYLPIPDSLSTGTYLLKAFSHELKNNNQTPVFQRLLTVYNRFDSDITQINTPVSNKEYFNQAKKISISTGKEKYDTREKVNVKIEIPVDMCSDLSELIITAGLADPLSEEFNSFCIPASQVVNHDAPMYMTEKNGVLVNGRVFENNNPVPGAIVLLSIPDSIPYFDYCISDSNGSFCFYLRNATGRGNLAIQARSKDLKNYDVQLTENYIETKETPEIEDKTLFYEQKNFAETIINASYFNKLFTGYPITQPTAFSIPVDFDFPFYGEPTTTVYPKLFIDLPNFTEISRELLHGVQYREKKDRTTIRMYNYSGDEIFNGEPLKLLDGIPVFDPHIFSGMGTNDIKKIDIVFYERFFGDLSFQGVLAVYSQKQSLNWIDEPSSGVKLFNYSCLQNSSNWTLKNIPKTMPNIPDFRSVYYRENTNKILPVKEFNFSVSDLKGKVAIRVTAVTKQDQISYISKLIDVQ